MLTTKEIIQRYGEPNRTGEDYLVIIDLPYPMRLAWDLDKEVTKMRCHKLVYKDFIQVFNDILSTYGLDRIKELEIDVFGGCFASRS